MAYLHALLFVLLATNAFANTHKGDNTVGGVHFFEVHSQAGGSGIGIKIIIFLLLIGVFAYSYYKWRNYKRRLVRLAASEAFISNQAVATAAAALPKPAQPQTAQFPLAVYAPCRHGRYPRPQPYRQSAKTDTEADYDARLP